MKEYLIVYLDSGGIEHVACVKASHEAHARRIAKSPEFARKRDVKRIISVRKLTPAEQEASKYRHLTPEDMLHILDQFTDKATAKVGDKFGPGRTLEIAKKLSNAVPDNITCGEAITIFLMMAGYAKYQGEQGSSYKAN